MSQSSLIDQELLPLGCKVHNNHYIYTPSQDPEYWYRIYPNTEKGSAMVIQQRFKRYDDGEKGIWPAKEISCFRIKHIK